MTLPLICRFDRDPMASTVQYFCSGLALTEPPAPHMALRLGGRKAKGQEAA